MYVSMDVEIEVPRALVEEALKSHTGKKISFSDWQRVEFDADEVQDVEPFDLETMYNELKDWGQADFLNQIKQAKIRLIEENNAATNLAESAELELLLSFRGKYSLDELKRRLEATDFLTDLNTQTGGCWNCGESGTVAEYVNG